MKSGSKVLLWELIKGCLSIHSIPQSYAEIQKYIDYKFTRGQISHIIYEHRNEIDFCPEKFGEKEFQVRMKVKLKQLESNV